MCCDKTMRACSGCDQYTGSEYVMKAMSCGHVHNYKASVLFARSSCSMFREFIKEDRCPQSYYTRDEIGSLGMDGFEGSA